MQAITIKQFAEDERISYEAARRSFLRYMDTEPLRGHYFKKDRTTFLDDEAVKFLKTKRGRSPVVVYRENRTAEMDALKARVEELREQLDIMQKKLIASHEHLQQIEQKNALLAERIQKAEQEEAETVKRYAQAEKETAEAVKRYAEEKARADVATIRADAYQAKVDALEGRLTDAEARAKAAEEEARSYERGLFGFYRKRRP